MREVILGLALALAASTHAPAQQIFFDDFSGGNDAQWIHADPIGGSTYAVTGGRYHMASVPLPPLAGITAFGSFIGDSFPNVSEYADGTLRASLTVDNGATNAFVVARTNAAATAGYAFSINNANPSSNFIGVGFIGNPAAAALVNMPISDGVEYIIEASWFGPELALEAWQADQPEPAAPQVMWTDTTFTSGHTGLGLYNQPSVVGGVGGRLSGSFDNVSFTVPAPGVAALLTVVGASAARRRRPSLARSTSELLGGRGRRDWPGALDLDPPSAERGTAQ